MMTLCFAKGGVPKYLESPHNLAREMPLPSSTQSSFQAVSA
jgi:hypothetical protein